MSISVHVLEMPFEILSPSAQVAIHLQERIIANHWKGLLPGTPALSAELGVDRKTVIAAIAQLEEEGLLISQGPGRNRKILLPDVFTPACLNIRVIPYEDSDRQVPYVLEITHRIRQLGHSINLTPKNLTNLGMDTKRISKYVEAHPADAWILCAGSREVLEWFAAQKTPAFAIFGRRRQVNISSVGPDKRDAIRSVIRRLVALGHRRIVYLVREERRKPSPGILERQFLEELESHGIPSGPYSLPNWEDDPDSFHECLERLFKYTPPTAIITDEAKFFVATQQHLALKDIIAPRDVSLVCCDTHPLFDWCQPQISHIRWDIPPVVDHTVHWVSELSRGKNERKASFIPAEFIEGGTIGPAKT